MGIIESSSNVIILLIVISSVGIWSNLFGVSNLLVDVLLLSNVNTVDEGLLRSIRQILSPLASTTIASPLESMATPCELAIPDGRLPKLP